MKTSIATLVIGISTLTLSGCFTTSSSSEEATPGLRSEFTASGNYEKELTDTEIQTDLESLADELDIKSLDISGLQNNINGLSIDGSTDDEDGQGAMVMRLARSASAQNCMPIGDLNEEATTGVKGSGQYSYEKVVMSGPSQICQGDSQISFAFVMDIEEEDGENSSTMHMDGKYAMDINEAAQSMTMDADFAGYGSVTTKGSTVNLSFLMDMNMTMGENNSNLSMNMNTIVHLMDDKYRCTIDISTSGDLFSGESTEPEFTESNTCELTHNGQVVGSLQLDGEETGVYDLDGNKITK